MKICQPHWDLMRKHIEERGLSSLVSKDSETVIQNMVADLNGEPDEKNERFDPLMSMNWHWMNHAVRLGGPYLLYEDENGEPYCPLCEFEKHYKDFNADESIGKVAEQIADYCRLKGMIPPIQ